MTKAVGFPVTLDFQNPPHAFRVVGVSLKD